MKTKTISVLIVLVVLASVITACIPKDNYLLQVMKIAPEDTILIWCVDVKAMAEDPDFGSIYDNLWEGMSGMISGVNDSDISALSTIAASHDDFIWAFIGDFNLVDVRNALMDEEWVEGEYDGVEIWTCDYESAITFIDNMIVIGYDDQIEACIRIYKDEEPSMYNNEDSRAVVDKLPIVPYRIVFGADYYTSESGRLANSIGVCNENRDDDVLDISVWSKFDTEAIAEAAMEDIEDVSGSLFMGATITSIDARQSGQFIEITGEIEIP